jgi:ribosome-associated protein
MLASGKCVLSENEIKRFVVLGGLLEKVTTFTAKETAILCINAALEKKPKDLVIMNIRQVSSFADYYILMTGSSDREVQAISSIIQEKLKENGIRPLSTEGTTYGKWILLDYIDVVISIFHEPLREFYDLERLWSDAPSMKISDDTVRITALSDGM